LVKIKIPFLVNIARGAIINEEALYNALKNNVIAGAALDVWYNYHPEVDNDKKYPYDSEKFPFHELDNVILSPHRAASPHDDLKRWDEVIENISRFAEGEKDFINVVDIEKGY
jgi:phosphoglycerate dehydrogenase-like enzyme